MWSFLAALLLLLALGVTSSELSSRDNESKPEFVTVGSNMRFSFNGTYVSDSSHDPVSVIMTSI
jgi:hypothetical protein